MKTKLLIIVFLFVWFSGINARLNAQPNWEVNPQEFEFSMTITGKVTTNGYFSIDENDIVAAFINGQCRGIVNLKYESFMGSYFAYLMVYSNNTAEDITFKIFDASENLVISAKDTIVFGVNSIIGSLDEPIIFSSNLLNNEAKILSFEISNQVGETVIENDTISLEINYLGRLNELVASFALSQGAKVYINGVPQNSGITLNDFTHPMKYTVISADFSDTTYYVVQVEINENNPPDEIHLSNTLVSEASEVEDIIGTLTATDPDNGDYHVFSLVPGDGYNDSGNPYFSIEGNNLVLKERVNFAEHELLRILIQVADNQNATFIQEFIITVTNSNNPPVFKGSPASYVLQDQVYVYPVEVEDADGDDVSLSIENLPGWLSFNPLSNVISGSAGNDEVGDYSFKVTASDGKMEATQSVILSVINVNDPPEINFFIAEQYFFSNRSNEIQLPLNCIIDPDENDELTFSLSRENNSALPEWLYFEEKSMVISGNPPKGLDENINLKLTATDEGNLREWIVFKLVVSVPTSLVDYEEASTLICYPNPVNDVLTLINPPGNENTEVWITNSKGQVTEYKRIKSGSEKHISFYEKNPGLYVIKTRQNDSFQIKKIIKY
jgi:hypothetical protein